MSLCPSKYAIPVPAFVHRVKVCGWKHLIISPAECVYRDVTLAHEGQAYGVDAMVYPI